MKTECSDGVLYAERLQIYIARKQEYPFALNYVRTNTWKR